MTDLEFRRQLCDELDARGVLGEAAARSACTAEAAVQGDRALLEVRRFAGAETMRRALSVRRGSAFADTYRYVTGYGELMTKFLIAPVPLLPAARDRIARLGALANLIVSHVDEMVDGGWPRVLLLPQWALAIAPTRAGRVVLRVGASIAPSPPRFVIRLVTEYFRRVAEFPYARQLAGVRADLYNTITKMYAEEARTPSEWRRRRGDAARQKKTALPFVVLGLPAWLASPNWTSVRYQRHRRWLLRVGRFIRWIDDAADLVDDHAAGSANVVRCALSRAGARADFAARLAAKLGQRGRWVLDEWKAMAGGAAADVGPEARVETVFGTVIVAWLGVPESAS